MASTPNRRNQKVEAQPLRVELEEDDTMENVLPSSPTHGLKCEQQPGSNVIGNPSLKGPVTYLGGNDYVEQEGNRGKVLKVDAVEEKAKADEGSQDGEALDGRDLNQEILQTLFKVCPPNIVANFRYVSTEWNAASLQAFRSTAQLSVVDYFDKPRKKGFEKLLNVPDLIKYMEDPDDPFKLDPAKDFRYKNYKLQWWYATPKNPNMVKFWDSLGTHMVRLELCDLRVDRMDTILQILYEKVPNLRTLILEKVFVFKRFLPNPIEANGGEVSEKLNILPPQKTLKTLKLRNLKNFPMDWVRFLKHFPSIQSLELVDVKSDENLALILTAIANVRADGLRDDVLPLNSLSIIRGNARHRCVQTVLSPTIMTMLRNCDFKMNEFYLKMGCKTTRAISVDVLQIFAQDLKKLSFHIDFKCRNRKHRFPYCLKYPLLEELELWLWCLPETQLHVLSQCIPSLKILRVKGNGHLFNGTRKYYHNAITKDLKIKCHKYQSLEELSYTAHKMKTYKFTYLTVMAPNLTRLELKMNDRIFCVACKEYPNLVELRVTGKALTDKGILGLIPYGKWEQGKVGNITDLKKLRVFVLHNRKHRLTSDAVFNGFLKVQSLFTLQMSLPMDTISSDARRALEMNIQNLVVDKEIIPNIAKRVTRKRKLPKGAKPDEAVEGPSKKALWEDDPGWESSSDDDSDSDDESEDENDLDEDLDAVEENDYENEMLLDYDPNDLPMYESDSDDEPFIIE